MSGQQPSAEQTTFPVGKTAGEVIEDRRAWIASADVRATEAKKKAGDEKAQQAAFEAEQEKKRDALCDAVSVTALSKGFTPSSFETGRIDDLCAEFIEQTKS